MHRSKIICVISVAMLSLFAQQVAFAEDPGARDTLRIETIPLVPLDSSFTVELRLSFDERLAALVVPLSVNYDWLALDSVSFVGGVSGHLQFNEYRDYLADSNKIQIASVVITEGYVLPNPDTLYCRLYFSFLAGAQPQVVDFDTTTIVFNGPPTNHYHTLLFASPDDSVGTGVIPVLQQGHVGSGVEYVPSCDCPHQGDVDGSGQINLLDIVMTIDYVYRAGIGPPQDVNCTTSRGDVVDPSSDNIVNLLDIVYLINYVFNEGPAPIDPCTGL